jgi:hypothetical protein
LKKYNLLRIEHQDSSMPLLPIISDDPNAISNSPLAGFFINPMSSDGADTADPILSRSYMPDVRLGSDSTPSLLDPNGPWDLESSLRVSSVGSISMGVLS